VGGQPRHERSERARRADGEAERRGTVGQRGRSGGERRRERDGGDQRRLHGPSTDAVTRIVSGTPPPATERRRRRIVVGADATILSNSASPGWAPAASDRQAVPGGAEASSGAAPPDASATLSAVGASEAVRRATRLTTAPVRLGNGRNAAASSID